MFDVLFTGWKLASYRKTCRCLKCHTAVLSYHVLVAHLLSDRLSGMQGWQYGSWSKDWNDRIGSG